MPDLTKEQLSAIVKLIKSKVDENATYQFDDQFNLIELHKLCPSYKYQFPREKIKAMVVESGEYIFERDVNRGLFFYKNPNYKKDKWHDKHPVWYEIFKGALTGVITLGVGLLLWQADKRSKDQENNQQNLRIQRLSDSLTNLQKYIKDSVK